MGSLDGKVAFISGGARGQGRSHAVGLAAEGASIITFDVCDQIPSVGYPAATEDDLASTVKEVEAVGGKIVALKADVRAQAAVQAVLDEGVLAFGRVDIVIANAGIMPIVGEQSKTRQAWHDAIDINLTGVLHTCEAAIPRLLDQGQGGSIIIISSTAGLKGPMRQLDMKRDGYLGYIASKHAVIGLMRSYANVLGPYSIRCNTIHPTGVFSPMVANAEFGQLAQEQPALLESMHNVLPIPFVEMQDVTNAVLYLASDTGRFVTGLEMRVDAGAMSY
ncbi:mycofactocin-coupled SDR family oxidoreductase [Sporichthya sp.]|uniref:mycofactocin-coupled SDR family oxidoreductase n=1 Tax=Sporichthya sp. TaxID=65475 RepID=UPI00182F3298|nr:mycofactocin-coupled SDR family oxidoreductase [Sporichthya sp.]MBA3741369.1 mycofactocin-coupled SDR family oxidoreductase [Sporichthya sp.]